MRLISISTLLDLGYKTRQMNFHRSCSGRNFPLMFHWSFFLLLQAFLYCWYDELGNSSPIHCPVPTTHTTPHLKAVTKWEQNRQDHLQIAHFHLSCQNWVGNKASPVSCVTGGTLVREPVPAASGPTGCRNLQLHCSTVNPLYPHCTARRCTIKVVHWGT